MRKSVIMTETIITAVEPERVIRLADECRLEIRVVESRREAANWLYEYEVKGEAGKTEKFSCRLDDLKVDRLK